MMTVSTTIAEWQARRSLLAGKRIGFVPTMGALHAGHASLVERCRAENDVVAVSLFVNPTQFNDPKDLGRYPRTLEADLDLLRRLGTGEVLMPTADELYPDGYLFRVTCERLTAEMEGRHRPGFFDGVMTVVMKLLHLAGAGRAYFGEKDFQQLAVVKAMAADFFLPTEIIGCPTVRAENGLALSSRNALLSEAGREKAAWIHRALTGAASPAAAREMLEANGFVVDYVEEHWGRRFAAAFLEGVRLIDNVPVTESGHAVLS